MGTKQTDTSLYRKAGYRRLQTRDTVAASPGVELQKVNIRHENRQD